MVNIFDELKHAQGILERGFKNYVNLKELTILAKYFRHIGIDDNKVLENKIVEICQKHDAEFNDVMQSGLVSRAIKNSTKGGLRLPVPIPITVFEMQTIREIKNFRYEKILFTMLVLAKYFKLTNANNKVSDSVNYHLFMKKNYIFRFAHTAKKSGENILYQLRHMGLVCHSLRLGSFYFPKFNSEDKSDIALWVTDIENVVGYYHPLCDKCGIEIEKKSNRQKMCDECWKINNRDRQH